MKVSVIMPVYNSEKFLCSAIDSVLRQDFDEFELILVDDGSTDNSPTICDIYEQNNNNVTVIHQINQGICVARNKALCVAKGEYVGFCDNDDLYGEHLLADNYTLATKYNADVIRFCRRKVTTDGNQIIDETVTGGFSFGVIHATDFAHKYDEIKKAGNGVWTGLYRRKFLKKNRISFDETMRFGCEDQMFNIDVYKNAQCIVLNPNVYYSWLQRVEHSTTGKYSQNVVDSLSKCLLSEQELVDKNNIISQKKGLWTWIISRDYISELYERLGPTRSGNISDKDRKLILKHFRNDPRFHFNSRFGEEIKMMSWDKKRFLMWMMFKYHLEWPLYCLIFKRNRKKEKV